jgi:hypothetical protein
MELLLVRMALPQRRGRPGQDLRAEADTLQQPREFRLQHLLPRIRFGALPVVAGTMVIDVCHTG